MEQSDAEFIERVKEIALQVDRSEIEPIKAIEKLRNYEQIEDDYSALEYLVNSMNDPKTLFKFSLAENDYLKVLALTRLGEVVETENLIELVQSLQRDSLGIVSVLRGLARRGGELPPLALLPLYGKNGELDELLLETVSLGVPQTELSPEGSKFLLRAALFRGESDFSQSFSRDEPAMDEFARLSLGCANTGEFPLEDCLSLADRSDASTVLKVALKCAKGVPDRNVSKYFEAFKTTTAQNLYHRLRELKGRRPIEGALVQFSFQGDPFKPGRGSSGGMGIFLKSLGRELASHIGEVVTLVPLEESDWGTVQSLWRVEDPNHTFLYIPIADYTRLQASNFAGSQWELLPTVRDLLWLARIEPAYFHMRFSDYASLAMCRLGKMKKVKTFYTLTPDPQRSFSNFQGKLCEESREKVMRNTARAEISWRLLREVDGLVGIGGQQSKRQLISYYPPLLRENLIEKIEMVPEGISLRKECQFLENEAISFSLLFDKKSEFHISTQRRGLPLILSVGRVDPLKGQYKLLRAWGESSLADEFNLVLVGGERIDPEPVEKAELEKIHKYVRENPRLLPGFCHLFALDNESVRCLEKSIVVEQTSLWPPIYVSPSYKEEFGIAILEAMAEGFLALGPVRGGVKDYIQHARNGFLLDTTDETTLRADLTKILLQEKLSLRRLRQIVNEGNRSVYRRFSISLVAKLFAQFYLSFGEKGF